MLAVVALAGLMLVLPGEIVGSETGRGSEPEGFRGRVIRVASGDTLKVMRGRRSAWVRLEGIDCPEKGQGFWEKAKGFTTAVAFGQDVTVSRVRENRYRRELIGVVILPDGRNLNRELVREGLAWWYSPHSRDDSLRLLEIDARNAGRNIWTQEDPVPPWEYGRRGG